MLLPGGWESSLKWVQEHPSLHNPLVCLGVLAYFPKRSCWYLLLLISPAIPMLTMSGIHWGPLRDHGALGDYGQLIGLLFLSFPKHFNSCLQRYGKTTRYAISNTLFTHQLAHIKARKSPEGCDTEWWCTGGQGHPKLQSQWFNRKLSGLHSTQLSVPERKTGSLVQWKEKWIQDSACLFHKVDEYPASNTMLSFHNFSSCDWLNPKIRIYTESEKCSESLIQIMQPNPTPFLSTKMTFHSEFFFLLFCCVLVFLSGQDHFHTEWHWFWGI